jgi:hypothetical protein
MKNELERIWKEMGMTLFEVSSCNFLGRTEESHKNLS